MQEFYQKADKEILNLKYNEEITEKMVKEEKKIAHEMGKLNSFIRSHEATNPVSEMYLEKCKEQLGIMAQYREVLNERILIMSAMRSAAD